jgi:hypothetical protein
MNGSWSSWREIHVDLRNTVQGVVREGIEHKLFGVGFVRGFDEDERKRLTGVSAGENRVVDEVSREEIMASDKSKPGLGDAPESEQGFWWQPREDFHHRVCR